jgi:hypothetical protein
VAVDWAGGLAAGWEEAMEAGARGEEARAVGSVEAAMGAGMAADSGVARAAEKAADSVGAVKVAEVKEADD